MEKPDMKLEIDQMDIDVEVAHGLLVSIPVEEDHFKKEEEPTQDRKDTLKEMCVSSSQSSVCCRICQDVEDRGEMLSPCLCSGTLAMVHRECLEHWLTVSQAAQCEICHHPFKLESVSFFQWLCHPPTASNRKKLLQDGACFLISTVIMISLAIIICFVPVIPLILFSTVYFLIYFLYWMIIVTNYKTSFYQWMMTQEVTVWIPSAANTTSN